MNSAIWGPHAWIFLHSITLSYPSCPTNQDKKNYKSFFESLKDILPCDKCKLNYSNHLITTPLTDKILSNKESFIKWLIDIHNNVNKENGKPIMDYDSILRMYMDMYGKGGWESWVIWLVGLVILVVVGLCFMSFFYKKD